jgi:hypothetical protein
MTILDQKPNGSQPAQFRWDQGRLIPFSRVKFLFGSFPHAVLNCLTIPLDEFPELLGRRQRDQIA